MTSTLAPHGAWVSRWVTSASSSFTGSAPGTIRIEILALASGMRTFDDPAMFIMSTPMALIEGWAHRRSPTSPLPVSMTPSRTSALARRFSSLNCSPGQEPVVTPSTATSPVVVVERRQQSREGHHRVGRGASEDP